MNSAVKMLDRAAGIYSDKIAIEDEWGHITFNELRHKGMVIGSVLIKSSTARPGILPVIVFMPKSLACVVSFMGALYSGNPYVPVDAHIPLSRLQKIIDNLHPGHIITTAEMLHHLEECDTDGINIHIYTEMLNGEADEVLVGQKVDEVLDTDPIYIMYTSGSTGSPKGVTVPHRGVIDYAEWLVTTFSYDESTIMANQAPFYFDNSIFDIYGCLCCGGRMVIIPEPLLMFPSKLPEFLEAKEITSIFWVPTVMINVANSGVLGKYELPQLKTVAFCGEVMPNAQLNIWRRELPGRVYANLYGPTEITDACTCYIVDRKFADHEPLPLGQACKNMRIIILNEKDKLAAVNETGELCVVGTGVSLGYWNAPELTDKAFIQNPINKNYHERIYRTGDLACVNDDGLLMFIGRKDTQIKLKGNRIELGEIEVAAMSVKGVENACALFDQQKQEIVLFVETPAAMTLRKTNLELKKYMPAYMLPGRLIIMPKLPHTANDKIDRVTLRASLQDA